MARDDGAPSATIEDRPEAIPAAAGDGIFDATQVQNQLREKEQLVAALTERLEQAAEQLDRLRRTGVDKGRRPLAGGFPAEVVEDHKNTLEDLKRVIAQWDEMQAAATLGRIESQIVELRDLLGGSGHLGGHAGSHGSPPAALHAAAPAAPAHPPRERAPEAPVAKTGSKPGGNAWWEAQKAALLGEPVPPEVEAALAGSAAGGQAMNGDATEGDHQALSTVDLAGLSIPDLPEPIDFDGMTLDDARAAIRQRDTVIQQLRESLLLLKASGQLPSDVESLASVPQPLRARIAEIETQWQAKFRQVELDVSLERARLTREQAAVRQQQEALQKQLRKEGAQTKTFTDDGKGDESASSKRRWFRFMGKNGDDGSAPGPAENGD